MDPAPPDIGAHSGPQGQTGRKAQGEAVLREKLPFLCIACQDLICGGDMLLEPGPIFPLCTSASGRQSGCGLLPAKKRLAAARGKPNALLAPPEGG